MHAKNEQNLPHSFKGLNFGSFYSFNQNFDACCMSTLLRASIWIWLLWAYLGNHQVDFPEFLHANSYGWAKDLQQLKRRSVDVPSRDVPSLSVFLPKRMSRRHAVTPWRSTGTPENDVFNVATLTFDLWPSNLVVATPHSRSQSSDRSSWPRPWNRWSLHHIPEVKLPIGHLGRQTSLPVGDWLWRFYPRNVSSVVHGYWTGTLRATSLWYRWSLHLLTTKSMTMCVCKRKLCKDIRMCICGYCHVTVLDFPRN